jgi:hypothetical protein
MDSDDREAAEADAHILTLDVPDDAIERAAGVAPITNLGTLHSLVRLHMA